MDTVSVGFTMFEIPDFLLLVACSCSLLGLCPRQCTGPNAAVLAPRTGALASLLEPLLDTTARVLREADVALAASSIGSAPPSWPTAEELGLSLGGSHGLGDSTASSGTLVGTLSGAARRAVYAVRMPTNQQRAVSLMSAAVATAAALAKEAAERSSRRDSSDSG